MNYDHLPKLEQFLMKATDVVIKAVVYSIIVMAWMFGIWHSI